jgi:hypothetical protein
MGQIVALLAYRYSLTDGYNQLGKDDGCVVNCRAYKDTTKYVPVNDPYYTTKVKADRWEP